MQYIFDFDHTLFDTKAFGVDTTPYKEDGLWVTPAIWDILNAASYLYTDVVPFLSSLKKEDVRILTAITPELGPQSASFQKEKVERSGIREYVCDIIYMEGDKGPFMEDMHNGTPTIFVDDRLQQLLSVRQHCPQVQLVQMVRPGLEGSLETDAAGSIPIISSLAELSNLD